MTPLEQTEAQASSLATLLLPQRLAQETAGGILASTWTPRDYVTRRLLAMADAGAIVAGVAASSIPFRTGRLEHLAWALAALPLWLVVFKAYGLYDGDVKRIQHGTLDEVPQLFHAILLVSLGLLALLHVAPGPNLLLRELLIFGVVSFLTASALRSMARRALRPLLGPERVLFVGEGEAVPALLRKVSGHAEYGLAPIGLLATDPDPVPHPALPVVGHLERDSFSALARRLRVERIIIPHEALDRERLLELLHEAKGLSIKVSLLPQVFDALGPGLEIDDVEGVTVLGINPPVLPRSSRALKRAMDVVGAGVALLVAAPFLLAAMVAIRVESPGPVFFRQERVGRGDRRFKMLKLRTMVVDAEARMEALRDQSSDPHWLKLERDPRVTRVGRFLRRTSLDEMPQLINVLRGQMSLVGPRPLVPGEDRQVEGLARSRLDLIPGITGLWQVLGRTNIPFTEMVKLDYLYVANWTLWTDVRLLLRTLPAVISQRGVN